jgi:small subunit ribosomal protein S1
MTGDTITLTEDQQDGTAPAPEAVASDEAPASEQTVATIAVADEPVTPEPSDTIATAAAPVAEPAAPDDEAASPEPEAVSTPVADDDAASSEATPAEGSDDHADAPPAADEPEDDAPAPAPRPTGPEPTTMEELLAEQDSDIKSFKHGDVVEGTVVRIDKDEMLVDIGAKSEGVVSNRELYGRNAETQPTLAIGDTVLVYVLQPESPEGHVVLSLRRAGLERKWRAMQELFEAGTIIDAPVIDHNKGGLIVDCGIRGFVPISQIVDFPRRPQNEQPRDAAQEIAEKLQPYIGRKLRLKILEVNRKANRLILSEKVALYEERREKRDELFSSLQVGQKVTGSVRSIAPFGIFIDLGGIDGLVHKSELSWNKVNNPEAGYKVGDEVEAEVIDINHERGRISLSIRRLQPDPWESTVADFKVGDVIDGTVTKLVNFGAFVRVREGLEGLIHISELSHQRVAHPGDVVHEGQVLKLKIISLDSERHRLGLSLKQAEEPPARPMPELGAPAVPAGERRERRERRERPDRSYSPSDALAEPEGGIDTTLAAAFAQVRAQLADAEKADTPAERAEAVAEAAEAHEAAAVEEAHEAEAVVEAAEAVEAEAVAEAVEAEEVREIAEAVEVESIAEAVQDEAVVEAAEAVEAEAIAEAAAAEQVLEDAQDAQADAVAEAVEAEAVIDAVDAGAVEDPAEAEALLEAAETAEADATFEADAAEEVIETAAAVEAEAIVEAIEADAVVEAAEDAEEAAIERAEAAEAVVEAAEVVETEAVAEALEADAVAEAAQDIEEDAIAEAELSEEVAEAAEADASKA